MTGRWRPSPLGRRTAHAAGRRAALLVGAMCTAVAAAVAGLEGLVSAALGAGVVVLFLTTGLVPLLLAGALPVTAGVGLGLLLLTYTLRLALVLLALRLATRAEWLHEASLGGTVIVTALAWTVAHGWRAVVGSPHASHDPADDADHPGDGHTARRGE